VGLVALVAMVLIRDRRQGCDSAWQVSCVSLGRLGKVFFAGIVALQNTWAIVDMKVVGKKYLVLCRLAKSEKNEK